MAARQIDGDIDRLYQLAPDEFTPARNALAKTAGADAPAIKRLTKPPIAAWAVNQVYWQRNEVYRALTDAATELRQTHKAILSGKTGDVRAAGKAHEAAIDAALKAAISLLQSNGQPATDATRQAIVTTLRALPGEEPAGRLTRVLQPGGFEMLAGLSIASGTPGRSKETLHVPKAAAILSPRIEKPGPSGGKANRKATEPQKPVDPKVLARAREAAAKAARELREAEHTARREEFAAARAVREAEKAARLLEQARDALATAQQDVEAAEGVAAETERTRAAAEKRAAAAERALEAARRSVQIR